MGRATIITVANAEPPRCVLGAARELLCPKRNGSACANSGRNEMPDQKATMTLKEAATFLRIGRNQAYEAVKRGEIPAIRLGRRYLIPTAKLNLLLESAEIVRAERQRPAAVLRSQRQEAGVNVNVRLPISLFEKIRQAAAANQRSISKEIRARLNFNFESDRWPS